MPVSPSSSRLKGYALALLAAACWATGGLTAKWLFTSPSSATASWPLPPMGIAIDPTTLSAGRALSAFVILLVYLLVRNRDALRVSFKSLPFLAVFGVIGLAGVHYTYFKTISLTNVATAILLEYLAPIIVLTVSVLFLKHRLTWTLPVGVALSVTGCALVVGALGGGGLDVSAEGIAWGLASAAFFASYSLMGSWAAHRFHPATTLVYGLAFATVFWTIALGPTPILEILARPATLAAVIFVAVISTVVPFMAFLYALRYIAPTNATITSTVEPVIAGIGAYLLFGEAFTALQLLGGALVLAAIAVVQIPEGEPLTAIPPQE